MTKAGERLIGAAREMREALRNEREENLWNAFNVGITRPDGTWFDGGMSDGEWLVNELELDPDSHRHDPEEIKALIPVAADRFADNICAEVLAALTTARDDALEEAKQIAVRIANDAAKFQADYGTEEEDTAIKEALAMAHQIADQIEALKGSKS